MNTLIYRLQEIRDNKLVELNQLINANTNGISLN
jgi:hypothetical protein